jgi:hypothetical protein
LHTPGERPPEGPITLIANKDRNVITFVLFACFLYIHSVYVTLISEIRTPHLKASATVNADLEDVYFLADKASEVPMINFEIVLPFPDASSRPMVLEIIPKRVGRSIRGIIYPWHIITCVIT